MGNDSTDDYGYMLMWTKLRRRLASRVNRMDFSDRRGAYEDVLLLMGDLEDSED